MMEQLVIDALAKLLECLGVALSVKLAACNKALQQRIFENEDVRKAFWVNIDLSEHESLTDYQLSRLLTRVNARKYTKSINLRGCRNILGMGLSPVKHSRVLERISLVDTFAETRLDLCLPTLQSMVHHNLFLVDLSSKYISANVEFVRSLRTSKLERAQEQESLCDACQEPVAEVKQQSVVEKDGPPHLHCLQCCKMFCRRVPCPVELNNCASCEKWYCQACQPTWQCDECGFWHCNKCESTQIKCEVYKKQLCDECCRHGHGGIACCHICEKSICEKCRNDTYVSINYCNICDDYVCSGCRMMQGCSGCNEDFCYCHDQLERCQDCNGFFCGQGYFCKVTKFECCNKITCTDCSPPQSLCKSCDKVCCEEHAAECGVCKSTFCHSCQEFEHCSVCGDRFCSDHVHCVDCRTCEVRHCRECGFKSRCTSCAKRCDEDCDCKERPPKKQKPS